MEKALPTIQPQYMRNDVNSVMYQNRDMYLPASAKNIFQNRLENFSFFSMICVILSKWNQSVPNILKDNQDQSRSRPQFGFMYNKMLFSLLTLCHCSIHIFGIRLCHHYSKSKNGILIFCQLTTTQMICSEIQISIVTQCPSKIGKSNY